MSLSEPFEPPIGPVEETLARIWSQLLGLTCISRHDNFFDLGGTSLQTVLLAERLEQLRLKCDVPIFSKPVLSEYAAAITHDTRLPST